MKGFSKLIAVLALVCAAAGCADKQESRHDFDSGRQALQRGDLDRAAGLLQQYLDSEPRGELASRAAFLIAKAQIGMGDYDQARAQFERTITDYPASEEAHKSKYKLAVLSMLEGERAAARAQFSAICERPDGTLVRRQLLCVSFSTKAPTGNRPRGGSKWARFAGSLVRRTSSSQTPCHGRWHTGATTACRFTAVREPPSCSDPHTTRRAWVRYSPGLCIADEVDAEIALCGWLTRIDDPELEELASTSDSSLHFYERLVFRFIKEGVDILQRLNGAFILVIRHGAQLHLVRDGSGNRTVFYARHGNRWLFAIEPKALTSIPGFQKRVRPAALAQYLACSFVPGAGTMLEGVYELQPVTPYRSPQTRLPGRHAGFALNVKSGQPRRSQTTKQYKAPTRDGTRSRRAIAPERAGRCLPLWWPRF